jgi:tRNA(Arg) A34 adenosine deaminase TadA
LEDAIMHQIDFMRRAIELARTGSEAGHGGPFGCVIVKDGVIVGEGFNTVLSSRDPTAHGRPAMSTAFSKAKSRPTYLCSVAATKKRPRRRFSESCASRG